MKLTHPQLIAPLLAILLLLGQRSAHAETASLIHDDFGNITQRTSTLGATTYTYDALNCHKSESLQPPAGLAQTQNFTYDADGNRLSDGAGNYTYDPNSNKMLMGQRGQLRIAFGTTRVIRVRLGTRTNAI